KSVFCNKRQNVWSVKSLLGTTVVDLSSPVVSRIPPSTLLLSPFMRVPCICLFTCMLI
ncbi:hypothetical protein ALC57_13630, partial [Trachymyrmex cornetzi]